MYTKKKGVKEGNKKSYAEISRPDDYLVVNDNQFELHILLSMLCNLLPRLKTLRRKGTINDRS